MKPSVLAALKATARTTMSVLDDPEPAPEPEPEPTDSDELVTTKVIELFVILAVGAVGAIIPYFFQKGRVAKYVLSIGSAFGGGIFISAGLMHMLPEAIESWDELHNGEEGYPWIQFIAMCGFFLIFAIEYVFIDREQREFFHSHDGGAHNHDHHHNEVHEESSSHRREIGDSPEAGAKEELNESSALSSNMSSQHEDQPLTAESHKKSRTEKLWNVDKDLITYTPLTVVILLIALSVHAILTGFGMGAQTELENTNVYFFSIIMHKVVEVFSMSVSIVRSPLSFVTGIILNVCLCLMTPLGIAIGMIVLELVKDEGDTADWIACIANALSCGTFLYVSICEVIVPEFSTSFAPGNKKKSVFMQWMKFLALICGVGIMAGLAAAE